jgi:anti-sigma factor (TIGR02949 family)
MIYELSCEVAIEEFFAYLDRALAGDAVAELEEHLRGCLECCDKLAFTRRLDWFVRDRLREVTMPYGLEERIRRTLRRA